MIGKVNAMIKLNTYKTSIIKYFSVNDIIGIFECEEGMYFRQATVILLSDGSSHLVKETPNEVLDKMKEFGFEIGY